MLSLIGVWRLLFLGACTILWFIPQRWHDEGRHFGLALIAIAPLALITYLSPLIGFVDLAINATFLWAKSITWRAFICRLFWFFLILTNAAWFIHEINKG
jgi:hypothetical protein